MRQGSALVSARDRGSGSSVERSRAKVAKASLTLATASRSLVTVQTYPSLATVPVTSRKSWKRALPGPAVANDSAKWRTDIGSMEVLAGDFGYCSATATSAPANAESLAAVSRSSVCMGFPPGASCIFRRIDSQFNPDRGWRRAASDEAVLTTRQLPQKPHEQATDRCLDMGRTRLWPGAIPQPGGTGASGRDWHEQAWLPGTGGQGEPLNEQQWLIVPQAQNRGASRFDLGGG